MSSTRRGLTSAGRSIASARSRGDNAYNNYPTDSLSGLMDNHTDSLSQHIGRAEGFERHPVVPGLSMNFVPFHNIPPRSREVRRAQMDKETLEKQRLKSRTGGYHKYDEFQTIVGFEDGTPGFQNEAQRFDTDAVGEEQRLRQKVYAGKQQMYSHRRQEAVERDEVRWKKEQETKKAEEEKWKHYREEKLFGKKNIGSVPYNQINLQYNDGRDGDELRYQDDMIKWRAMQRARRLQQKMMGDNADPITGLPQELIAVPDPPDTSQRPTHRSDVRDKHRH